MTPAVYRFSFPVTVPIDAVADSLTMALIAVESLYGVPAAKVGAVAGSSPTRSRRRPARQCRVSWTPCHYGGARPWLHCTCGLRVAKLFKGLGSYYCRQCFDNPRYACQSKSTQGRLHFEACKLRLRLGGEASLSAPFPGRPRGMHRKTYARLRHRAEQLEARISRRVRARATDYQSLVYYCRL